MPLEVSMSYSDFTLPRVQTEFALTVQTVPDLFARIPPVKIDPSFQSRLNHHTRLALAINTEKARSEWLIAPVLAELWQRNEEKVSVFSGVPLDVDVDAGLIGRCDFLIGRPPQLHYVTAPLMVVVEAKNEDIAGGLGQCAAIMVGIQRFNERQKEGLEVIYGCVSDGTEWKFLRLNGTTLMIDLTEYHISQADRILGILLHVAGIPPEAFAAA
jgi:hypothetical protein